MTVVLTDQTFIASDWGEAIISSGTATVDNQFSFAVALSGTLAQGHAVSLVEQNSSHTTLTLTCTGLGNNSGFVLSDSSGNDYLFDNTAVPIGSQLVVTTSGLADYQPQGQTCFLAGTLIATPSGQTAVERLGAGDMVLTASGRVRPISWIGVGRVLATRGRRNAATPVIVRKGALAANVPHAELRVTKGHSLFLDGVLIPVEFLVNHRSILWDDQAQEVSIYHIELQAHDVLLANGAPAESYRDDGNRWLFQNANSGWNQAPKQPCAPVLTGGAVVDAIWHRLLARSGPRPLLPLTDDPDLHLLVHGDRLDAATRIGRIHVFNLLRVPQSVRVGSRAAVPQELGIRRDPRSLGVAVQRIVIRQASMLRVIEAHDPRLTEGFHTFEADNAFRWTNGDAVLPEDLFAGFAGPLELAVHCAGTCHYIDDGKTSLTVTGVERHAGKAVGGPGLAQRAG